MQRHLLYIPIWFYSNCIRRLLICPNILLYIPIWFYSNLLVIIRYSPAHTFTFQSGSIQINQGKTSVLDSIALYIPIWFYSNFFSAFATFTLIFLYIPIWFYSNPCNICIFKSVFELYIPIWFYSNAILLPPN